MSRLIGRVAIVTGAARGIGEAIALAFVREGADVIVADMNFQGAKEVADGIKAAGRRSLAIRVDVTKKEDVERMVEEAIKEFGKVDILVNDAAIHFETPIENITEREWNLVMDVNVRGAFYCCQAVLPHMKKRQYGKIINIASSGARKGSPVGGVHYSTSKGGVVSLTIDLSKKLSALGIYVNAISPGFIETDMTKDFSNQSKEDFLKSIPLGRLGKPEDIAKVAVFLASDESNYIVGQIINVDGGYLTF